MAIQIVMDRSGDSRHYFNADDTQELARAEQRFYELTGAGFTAAVRTDPGQVSQIRSFDPKTEETLSFPKSWLAGGQSVGISRLAVSAERTLAPADDRIKTSSTECCGQR